MDLRPYITHTFSYGDGLLNPTQLERQSSIINSTAAGILIGVGTNWNASYAITNTEYSNEFLTDSLNHDASISGAFARDNWTFGASQSFRTNSPILAETGQQTAQEFYTTTGNAGYQIGPRLLLELNASYNIRLANSNYNTQQWTTSDWYSWIGSARLRYKYSPKFEVLAGIDLSKDKITGSPDMHSTQPHVQLTWRPTKKLSTTARVGAERRRVEGDAISDLNNPAYSGSIQFEPFDTTSISVFTSQSVSASYYANLASKSRSHGVSLSQRLLEHFYLSLGYSVGDTRYIATTLNFIDGRRDDFTSYTVRIGTSVLTRGSVAVFAQRSHNSSNTRDFDFTGDQSGLEVGYRF